MSLVVKNALLVNNLKPVEEKRTKTAKGLLNYDQKFYESKRNKLSVKYFLKYCKQTESIVKRKRWKLDMKYNAIYCGFKYGFFNAFYIKWIGTKTFAFHIKLPKNVAEKYSSHNLKMDKYSSRWNCAVYYVDPLKTKTKSLIPLFERSYKEISGN